MALDHAQESCVALPWNTAFARAFDRLMSRCCQLNDVMWKPRTSTGAKGSTACNRLRGTRLRQCR